MTNTNYEDCWCDKEGLVQPHNKYDHVVNTELDPVCPHCETKLVNKMFDIDGTNLSEHAVCPDCGYGTPALL